MEEDLYSFAREHGLNERKVVDVSSGISPCGPSKKVRAAIRKAVREIRFSPDPYLWRLRRTVSSRLGVDGDHIMFANSVEELLHLISDVFEPPRVLAAGPLLDVHSRILSSSGAFVEHSDLPEGRASVADAVQVREGLGETGLVFVSQPNRITGCLADERRIDDTLEFWGAHNAVLVIDESLVEFTGDPGSCERAARSQGLIVLRSTANFYGLPGLSAAWAVSSPEIIGRLKGKKRCEVNVLAASAARAAVKDKTYAEATRKYIADERKYLVRSLGKIGGFSCPDSDSNVFTVKTGLPVDRVLALLARHGFLADVWRPGGSSGGTFLRVSVMEHEKNVKFLRVLGMAAGTSESAGG